MKKVIVILILLLIIPLNVKATKQEDLGKRIALVASSASTTYVNDFTYTYFWAGTVSAPISKKSVVTGYLDKGYQGIKASGYTYGFKTSPGIRGSFTNKFATYCETWALLIPYHAMGALSTTNPYQKISLNTSSLRPGDKVQYTYPDSHIAIYVDDNNDSDPDTYRIAEAAGFNGGFRVSVEYFSGKGHRGKITAMQRISESVANQISYNVINASTNFHDSLDHFKPVITSVSQKDKTGAIIIGGTDYKQYNGTVQNRDVEPANNGIVAYTISNSSVEPTNWTRISTRDTLNIEAKVSSNGTYYAWILDVGGNVASKVFTVNNIDSSLPSLGSATLTSTSNTITINVNGASDASGIKEYTYYINDLVVKTGNSNSYTFTNLIANRTYRVKYSVTDNANNVNTSSNYNITTSKSVEELELDYTSLNLLVGDTHTLKATVNPVNLANNLIWSSSNSNVASVVKGVLTAKNVGTTTISAKIDNHEVKCIVNVLSSQLSFITTNLNATTIGNNYSFQLKTNTIASFKLVSGTLPPGLVINDNGLITGVATTAGTYNFTVLATHNTKNTDKKFVLTVYEKGIDINNPTTFSIFSIIIPLFLMGGAGWYFYSIKNRNKF